MRKIIISFIVFYALSNMACSEDKEIGEVESLKPEYTLPQGKSPADGRIVELYNQYGTYVLYEYSDWDFHYDLTSDYSYVWPDPQYVGDMLDLLHDIWFRFYSPKFHRKLMPYKIFLADTLKRKNWDERLLPAFLARSEHAIALGYCSDTLRKMSPQTKQKLKDELQKTLWNTWVYSSVIEFPEEFFSVSDYSKNAEPNDVSSSNYARARGFVASGTFEWSRNLSNLAVSRAKETDISTFVTGMITRTSEAWALDLEFPLVKKKYDLVRDYFLQKYDFDIQKIGDAVYK